MAIEIRKAERRKSKLRLGLAGPSGAGKTMSALKLAKGLGGRVCMIDTERGSGDLYADLYDYDIITLEPPYAPKNYAEAIHEAERAGYDVIVIDSLSHAWSDEGGLLDQADKLGKSAKNSYTVWADLTPQHRLLVNTMLGSPCHIVATVRSKQAYELEEYTDSKGAKKSKPVKVGLAPVQREGMEYEFTIFMDIEQNHYAHASKDRTNMFKDEVFLIDENVGKRILNWLNQGKENITAQKSEVMRNLERLYLGVPEDMNDRAEFVRMAIPKLTGLAWAPENIGAVIQALAKIEDPKLAYDLVWENPAAEAVNDNRSTEPGTETQASAAQPRAAAKVGETGIDYPQPGTDAPNPNDIPF